MKIGIIGAGNIGGNLARRLCTLGHEVSIANSRDPETLVPLARETGAHPVYLREAVHRGEIVIVTIPMKNVKDLPRDLFVGVPESVIVVDTCNYYPQQRDGRIAEIEDGLTESQYVSKNLSRPVVKAFNNIYAEHILKRGKERGEEGRIALPVSGDDVEAKAVVLELIGELGFDGVDAGPLSESWRQQPGSPVYAKDFDEKGVMQALSEAKKERAPEWTTKEPKKEDNKKTEAAA